MPELIELIKEYGKVAYEAGVHECEVDGPDKRELMDELFKQIEWILKKGRVEK